jgi:hypothetical protein
MELLKNWKLKRDRIMSTPSDLAQEEAKQYLVDKNYPYQ